MQFVKNLWLQRIALAKAFLIVTALIHLLKSGQSELKPVTDTISSWLDFLLIHRVAIAAMALFLLSLVLRWALALLHDWFHFLRLKWFVPAIAVGVAIRLYFVACDTRNDVEFWTMASLLFSLLYLAS